MTPNARIASAIEILDAIFAGAPAEKTLTTWGRRNRFAGSKDRAAIRDLVFDALRCRRSYGWLGGGETGRAVMLGAVRASGTDVAGVFNGERFAATVLTDAESVALQNDPDAMPEAAQLDMPDWLLPQLRDSLGDDLPEVCETLRKRAPVFLRVNVGKCDVAQAMAALAQEDIKTTPHPLSPMALQVLSNPRRIQNSDAFRDGCVELQDAASQALVDTLPVSGKRVLDYCAGGGGKSLAMAALGAASVVAHDADEARMRDIPVRAARAGVSIKQVGFADLRAQGPFEIVLCDAPCSGSGAWRRSPDAKWRLTPDGLRHLVSTQAEILDCARTLVAERGVLAYATCSLLSEENEAQVQSFLRRHPGWQKIFDTRFSPLQGGDGFYVAHLTQREKQP